MSELFLLRPFIFVVGLGAVLSACQQSAPTRNANPTTVLSATSLMQAESYSAQNGTQNAGTFVASLDNADWLKYSNMDFGSGVNKFSASMAVDAQYAGQQLDVRLDSTTGPLVGTLTVAATGSWNTFTSQSTPIDGASGVHDLYLVAKGVEGIGNIDSFVFTSNTVTPPPPPPSGLTVYVAPNGNDTSGDGSSGAPFRSLAKAASVTQSGQTIQLAAGTYTETKPAVVALGVNILGAGEGQTILDSSGVELAPGVSPTANDFKLWYDGSLIQLISAPYPAPNPRYGSPSDMLPAEDGNQTLSGFTIEGNEKLKAGIWVENRNNVTLHHITFKNLAQRGAVLAKGDMHWYQPMPEGKWMKNTTAHDLTFINSGTDLSGESLGNLCLAGLDGADIYNINISEDKGYGIKFIYVGHFKNTKIHDSYIRVPEVDSLWGEDISIELWNFSGGNEVYNIDANTWFSFVNHPQLIAYQPTGTEASNLKIYNNRIVDLDGVSGKETVESALSGVQIYDNYFQDKGYGVAIWGSKHAGATSESTIKNVMIHHNVFANVNRTVRYGFGNSSGIFIPDLALNINIYNNVFDRMGNALTLTGGSGVQVKNNVFLGTDGNDATGGTNVTFDHNLKFHSTTTKAAWNLNGVTLGANNILGDPGFNGTGARPQPYYAPSGDSSRVVNAGVDVGFPFIGSAPDIGTFERTP
jgi:hypothetical protein